MRCVQCGHEGHRKGICGKVITDVAGIGGKVGEKCDCEHEHKWLPSKGCQWRCQCGDFFVVCVCGKCPDMSN